MTTLTIEEIETEIVNAVEELNKNLKIGAAVDGNFCPGGGGFASQVLITVMTTLEINLGITIPNNVYIFHDKKGQEQLSIIQAAKKLKRILEDGK